MSNIAVKNFEQMIHLMEQIQFSRDPSEFVEWLTTTDFFIAPASRMYHDSQPGGLYNHCRKLYTALLHLNSISKQEYTLQTLFYMAFGHDLAKVDSYKECERWRKDDKGKWQSYKSYEVIDSNPLPHGTKSLVILQRFVTLTDAERLAIVYHMGSYNVAKDSMSQGAFYSARSMYPLVSMVHLADMMAVDVI